LLLFIFPMGNSSSSLPFSIDQQVGAPHDHNGWALHKGKSKDSSDGGREVSVFVGKKPALSKTPIDRRQPHQTHLDPALHHYDYCRKLRHPHILKVFATLDTDNPSAASVSAAAGSASNQQNQSQQSESSSKVIAGDLIVVTEPCIPLSEWLLGAAASGPPTPEQLAWGLECVIEGLAFLHTSANIAHGSISPQSLYVTPSGDVKLWNFSLVTPVGPNSATSAGGPDGHFLEWEAVCCPESYRSPERVEQKWDVISSSGGVHSMDSYSLGVLIGDYWYRNASTNANNVPQVLKKALQRMTTTNIKMRPRLEPWLNCPVFDTQYKKIQRSLLEISIQPVEQKIFLWQNLGQQMQQQTGVIPKDFAKYKILPLIITTIQTTCKNESMLSQDMYRREILAMLSPLFFIEEHYQDPQKVGKELAPIVAKLFTVPDRGVRSVLLNTVGFFTKTLNQSALNTSVFEPLCSGFNDSSPVLREMTLKATHALVPSLTAPNLEKLSRYLVRLQSDAETSLRTNAVIFFAKIAPHLSEVSKQKMLLPAYSRSMKDPFSPCRLSALQSLMQSKALFTKQDLAVKVMPCVMPLLLDPMTDIRTEAFRVVRDFLEEIQQESNLMTERGDPLVVGVPNAATNQPQQPRVASAAETSAAATTSGVDSSTGSSSGYLSGISSWIAAPTTATQPSKPTPPKPMQTAQPIPTPQPPIQQFASTLLHAPKPAPAPTPAEGDGWGDDDDDDGWGDVDVLAFSDIGGGAGKQSNKPATATKNSVPSMSSLGGGMDDDPLASLGMKTVASAKPRAMKGKLVLPKKAPPAKTSTKNSVPSMAGFGGGMDDDPLASLGMKTVASSKPRAVKGKLILPKKAPQAKKLIIDASEMGDGWDDF
jgi:SCY1-like protein 1